MSIVRAYCCYCKLACTDDYHQICYDEVHKFRLEHVDLVRQRTLTRNDFTLCNMCDEHYRKCGNNISVFVCSVCTAYNQELVSKSILVIPCILLTTVVRGYDVYFQTPMGIWYESD